MLFNAARQSLVRECAGVYLLPCDETCRKRQHHEWNENAEQKPTMDYHLFNILYTKRRRNSHSRWIHRLSDSHQQKEKRKSISLNTDMCDVLFFPSFSSSVRAKVGGNKWRLSQLKFSPFIWEDRCDIETINSRAYRFIEVFQFIGIHCKSSTKFRFEHSYRMIWLENKIMWIVGFAWIETDYCMNRNEWINKWIETLNARLYR